MTHGAMVMIDGDSLSAICPYHGLQAGADYAPGRAACGCDWRLDSHALLRAHRAAATTFATETAELAQPSAAGSA